MTHIYADAIDSIDMLYFNDSDLPVNEPLPKVVRLTDQLFAMLATITTPHIDKWMASRSNEDRLTSYQVLSLLPSVTFFDNHPSLPSYGCDDDDNMDQTNDEPSSSSDSKQVVPPPPSPPSSPVAALQLLSSLSPAVRYWAAPNVSVPLPPSPELPPPVVKDTSKIYDSLYHETKDDTPGATLMILRTFGWYPTANWLRGVWSSSTTLKDMNKWYVLRRVDIRGHDAIEVCRVNIPRKGFVDGQVRSPTSREISISALPLRFWWAKDDAKHDDIEHSVGSKTYDVYESSIIGFIRVLPTKGHQWKQLLRYYQLEYVDWFRREQAGLRTETMMKPQVKDGVDSSSIIKIKWIDNIPTKPEWHFKAPVWPVEWYSYV